MKRCCLVALAIMLTLNAAPGYGAARQAAAKATAVRQAPKERQEAPAVNILSIIPAQGEPGSAITVSGTGFGSEPSVFLGMQQVPARSTDQSIISFDIPEVAAGLYALYLRRSDGTTSKVYNFSVLPRKPSITSISPDRISACSGRREIAVRGAHFGPDSRIAFDGALIPATVQGSDLITVILPQVPGGLHHLQVRNLRDETASAPTALTIETKPEIISVRRGADSVNSYELIIEGRNFLQGSTLVVDGKRLSGSGGGMERERVYYGGCESITYLRFPYDTTPRTIRIQVLNSTGEESGVYEISTP